MKNNLIFISVIVFLLSITLVSAYEGSCLFGDFDGNCVIDSSDIGAIDQYNLGLIDSSAFVCNPNQLDVTGDLVLDSADKSQLQAWMMGFPYTFEGKPTNIEILSDDVIDTIKVGDVLNLYALVTDSDGTPRPCIGLNFTTDAGTLSVNDGLTDVDGKIYFTLTIENSGNRYFTAFMKGDKGIDDINYTINTDVNSIPAEILVNVTTPDFNVSNIKVGDVYNIEVLVLDNDGLPKPNVDLAFNVTSNIGLSTYYATTDINGKVYLNATALSYGNATLLIKNNSLSFIGDFYINAIPTPSSSGNNGGSGGGRDNHNYENTPTIKPISSGGQAVVEPVIPGKPTEPEQEEVIEPIVEPIKEDNTARNIFYVVLAVCILAVCYFGGKYYLAGRKLRKETEKLNKNN